MKSQVRVNSGSCRGQLFLHVTGNTSKQPSVLFFLAFKLSIDLRFVNRLH